LHADPEHQSDLPDGGSVTYGYDDADRPTSLSPSWDSGSYGYEYFVSSGHFIDTLWDVVDLGANLRNCLGDTDSLSCYMVPVAAAGVVGPGLTMGPVDNAIRAGRENILIVGENSFEYSQNLRRALGAEYHIVATSYESRHALQAMGLKVPRSRHGFWVRTDIDATNLAYHFPSMKFDAIIFNNPHVGSGQTTASLISDFVQSARGQLRVGGELHINVT
jgi:hypothetical protein